MGAKQSGRFMRRATPQHRSPWTALYIQCPMRLMSVKDFSKERVPKKGIGRAGNRNAIEENPSTKCDGRQQRRLLHLISDGGGIDFDSDPSAASCLSNLGYAAVREDLASSHRPAFV